MEPRSPPNRKLQPPKEGEPPLHRAARLGDHAEIRRLIAAGADVNATFDIGPDPSAAPVPTTPLMVAAGSGDGASAGTLSLLLELGADPTIVLGRESAATFASVGLGWNHRPGGDAARLQLLLDRGSPLPAHPGLSNLLLCRMAANGDPHRLRLLLAHALRAEGYFDPSEAARRYQAVMECMAEHMPSLPDPVASLPEETRASLAESLRFMRQEMIERCTGSPNSDEIPLFCAARSGNAECVRLLLAAGAYIHVRDHMRHTAMYYVGSVEVARELMRAGLPLEDTDVFGWSPLCSALSDDEPGLPRVRALIAAGANVNATHDHGYTVFMAAVGSSRTPELIRLLVASGADPHAISEYGYNAFHAAIDVGGEANAAESVRDAFSYLKSPGVDIEHRNSAGHTPLARAVYEGTGIDVRVLCELGADPNVICPLPRCGDGACTSTDLPLLFHLAHGGRIDAEVKMEALLRAGADPLAEDPDGFTPLMHTVAYLCRDARDYAAAYEAFFDGLVEVDLDAGSLPGTRDAFVQEALARRRTFVESFAAGIPIPSPDAHTAECRRELITCISLLCAYESWARHE